MVARRLPNARAGGAYAAFRAHELAAAAIRGVVASAGVDPGQIDDVILGNATGGGGNVARLAALTAGLPDSVPGLTVDRQCGSGLEAVVLAARLVQAGAGELYVAGGVESISTAPARAHRAADGTLDFYDRAQFAPLETGDPDAGTAAENVARHFGISRERQDAYAVESHRRAVAAARGGLFDGELLPFAGLAADQGPRPTLDGRLMARFPPAFVPGGTVTAGNSCPFSDGAAVMLVAELGRARELVARSGATVLQFQGSAVAGNDPNLLGVGAAHAMRRLLDDRGLSVGTLRNSSIEFNEAFASQVLATADLLGLDATRFNRDGGALALGHPYGASGAVLVTRLLAQAQKGAAPGGAAPVEDLFAMISMAGGMGIAAHFRPLEI
nr:thiolase family protein [Arthrobacter stackebrandtii]